MKYAAISLVLAFLLATAGFGLIYTLTDIQGYLRTLEQTEEVANKFPVLDNTQKKFEPGVFSWCLIYVIDEMVRHQIRVMESAYVDEPNPMEIAEYVTRTLFVRRLWKLREKYIHHPWGVSFIDFLIQRYTPTAYLDRMTPYFALISLKNQERIRKSILEDKKAVTN
jgi:hypothetical protein